MDDVISIPNIGIQKVGVNEIAIPNITQTVPVYQPPPVVVNIGVPIVDMPGCVKYHPDAKKNREQPNLFCNDIGYRWHCGQSSSPLTLLDFRNPFAFHGAL